MSRYNICPNCGEKSKYNLKSDKDDVTKKEKKYYCKNCNQIFSNKKFGRIPKGRSGISRGSNLAKNILNRDNNCCRLCLNNENLQIHHITPVVLGGSQEDFNLITLCYRCHHFIHYCNPMIVFGKVGIEHRKLTLEGLERAKAQGKILGRPWSKEKLLNYKLNGETTSANNLN